MRKQQSGSMVYWSAVMLMAGLTGCVATGHPAVDPAGPRFDPIAFFAGRTQGTGTLAIALHHPEPTLVEGEGRIEGSDTIVLDQNVRRGDRAPTRRQWRLTRIAPDRYAGTLTDAAGPVAGDVHGNRLHLAFPMKGGLRAQQWLTLDASGERATNVMLVTKLGVPVARLDETIVRRH